MVVNMARPVAGATQRYQIELAAGTPACAGSPVSAVAERLLVRRSPSSPIRATAAAQASLGGGSAVKLQLRETDPRPPEGAATAIWYSCPATILNEMRLEVAVPSLSFEATGERADSDEPR